MSRFVVTRMARGHIYEDPGWLSGDRLSAKLGVTRAPGARHASVRFVSGALDRVECRAAFLDLARRADLPMLVIYGDQTPPRSRAEIEALAEVPGDARPFGSVSCRPFSDFTTILTTISAAAPLAARKSRTAWPLGIV
jgi:hypothetical protein